MKFYEILCDKENKKLDCKLDEISIIFKEFSEWINNMKYL